MPRLEVRHIPPMAQSIDGEIAKAPNPPYYGIIDEVINGYRSSMRLSSDGKEIVRHTARFILDSLYEQLHVDNKPLPWKEVNPELLKDQLTGATRYRKPEDRPLNEMRNFLAEIDGITLGSASNVLVAVISESVEMLRGGISTYDAYKNRDKFTVQKGSFMGTTPGGQRTFPKPGIEDDRY